MLLPMIANADAVEIDGIYYNLITKAKTAEVTENPNYYVGSVDIPESVYYEGNIYNVTAIGKNAFSICKNLTNVTIPNSVTSIGNGAFQYCTSLTSITIPNSVTSIGEYAFGNCTGLTSITIPNSVASINESTFYKCTSLVSVTIPNSVTIIDHYAFRNCTSLTNITIPNSVTRIGTAVFEGCTSLNSITIPNSVTNLGNAIFSGCKSLSSVMLPNSITSILDNSFENCTNLTSVTIPNSVTSIGSVAFYRCTSLTSITIPNNVTSIGSGAFYDCSSLTSISIGSEIKKIKNTAFKGCPELQDVYCYAKEVPNTNSDVFQDSYIEYATLHVPEESISSYETSSPWNQFQSIVPLPKYKLTYMLDDVVYKVGEYEEGTSITPEPNPTKEGYTFSGWSDIPETMPAHDVIVTGSFSINSYKLTYLVDDVEYKSYEIEYGTAIIPETEPTKDGYSFSGWSEIPETMPAHDVTVTGTFTPVEDMLDGHEYVDLGLPSGKCWATTNYGSDTPEGYGTYLEWGDNSIVSSSWGTDWMTPSFEDIRELQNNCSWIWDSKNGHNGYTVKGANGNSIFLPASGYKMVGQSSAKKIGEWVYYWTSTQSGEMAKIIMCTSIEVGYGEMNASLTKLPIRPITKKMSSDIKGVTSSMADELQDIVGVYDMQGHKLNSMVKGINIVKFRNGSLKKVIK